MQKSLLLLSAVVAVLAEAQVCPIKSDIRFRKELRVTFRGTGCSFRQAEGFSDGMPLKVVLDGVTSTTAFPEVASGLKDGVHVVRIAADRPWQTGALDLCGTRVRTSPDDIGRLFATRAALARHPRMLVTPEDDPLAALRDETSLAAPRRHLRKLVLGAAEEALQAKPGEYARRGRRLRTPDGLERNLLLTAAAYRITGERRFAERARAELLAVCAWPDWVPDHYLGTAQMLHLVAYAFDWIHDALSEDERQQLYRDVCRLGLDPMDVGRNGYWRGCAMNWNQVCYEGVVAAAVAFHEFMPERADRLIAEAANHVQYAIEPYAPNGAYPEGVSYWSYGTGRCVRMLQLMDFCFGTVFALDEMPGFLATGGFRLAMTGGSGCSYNFSDGGRKPTAVSATQAWLGLRAGRPEWMRFERSCYEKCKIGGDQALSFLLLRGFPGKAGEGKLPLDYYTAGANPVAAFRSGHGRNAATAGVKGGSPSVNHAHMDVGSFIYDCDGVRWADDLGAQDYHSIEKLGTISLWNRAQDSSRWSVFRLSPFSHNLVTLGGARQRVDGFADLVPEGEGRCRADLTSLFGTNLVTTATRRFALDRATRTLTVTDDIAVRKPGETLRWCLTTGAEVRQVSGNVVRLASNGKNLTVTALAPADVTWRVEDIAKGPNEWDCANPNRRQLVFRVPAASGTTRLAVCLSPDHPQ